MLKYFQDCPEIDIGTICSGLEPLVIISKAITEAVLQFFGIKFALVHKFACEIKAENRAFIMDLHGPAVPVIYGDASALVDANPHDYVSHQPVTVPPVPDAGWFHQGSFPKQA